MSEVRLEERLVGRPSLDKLFGGVELNVKPARNAVIVQAYNDHDYTLKEIADHAGVHYSTVSRVQGRTE